MGVNGTINKRTDKEMSMGRNDGRVVIFLYNLYMLFLCPLLVFLAGLWSVEANVHKHGGSMVTAVLIVFIPEVIFGLSWGLNKTFGSQIFTILCSMVAGWLVHKLLYHYFVVRAYAPITYYTTNIMMVLGIIWTIVIEFNQALRDHLLLFPREKWLVPNSEDETENSYWSGFWKVLFWSALAFMIFVKFLR